MNVVETVLIFVGIPAGAFALITAAVLAPSASRAPRYRPNGGWSYEPVWYLPHPAALSAGAAAVHGPQHAIEAAPATEAFVASGGASGEW